MYRNNCNETYFFDDYNRECTDTCECPCTCDVDCDSARNTKYFSNDDCFKHECECERDCRCMVGPTGPEGCKGATGMQGPRGLHVYYIYAKKG